MIHIGIWNANWLLLVMVSYNYPTRTCRSYTTNKTASSLFLAPASFGFPAYRRALLAPYRYICRLSALGHRTLVQNVHRHKGRSCYTYPGSSRDSFQHPLSAMPSEHALGTVPGHVWQQETGSHALTSYTSPQHSLQP